MAQIVTTGLMLNAWPKAAELPSPTACTVKLTVQQARGSLPDQGNREAMCKDLQDAVCRYLGWGEYVVSTRGKLHVWFRAADGADGPLWVYEWQRGPDGTEIELEVP